MGALVKKEESPTRIFTKNGSPRKEVKGKFGLEGKGTERFNAQSPKFLCPWEAPIWPKTCQPLKGLNNSGVEILEIGQQNNK